MRAVTRKLHGVLGGLLLGTASCARLLENTARDPEPLAPQAPSRPWNAAAHPVPPGPAFAAEVSPDPQKEYDLPDLVDLGLRANPDTRVAWEQARAAAARVGLADSSYFPVLAVAAEGGYARIEDRSSSGPVFSVGPALTPVLRLQWVLFDFGRRDADFDSAVQQLRGTNLIFNRKLQTVAFSVQQSFYSFDASRAQVEAAKATLRSAISVQEAADARLDRGLATKTEALLARQERVRAEFDVQAAWRLVADSQSALAESLGISPSAPLRVVELSQVPLPATLREQVEEVMDRALAARPDLGARLADLRAREAEVRRARAEFLPTIGLRGFAGGTGGQYEANHVPPTFDYVEPIYATFLQFSWTLFDGYARENAVRQAEARRGEAEAALTQLQLRALRDVWKSYADVQVALLQIDFAKSLLDASEDAYEAALESYRSGLADIVELLAAERDLARARSTMIDSRAELLRSSSALAYAAGDVSP